MYSRRSGKKFCQLNSLRPQIDLRSSYIDRSTFRNHNQPMSSIPSAAAHVKHHDTALAVLVSLSFCHFLNDMLQSLLPSIYPVLRNAYALDFGQIGLITLSFQLTASILQPLVGWYTDRKPLPYSLAIGMMFTGAGLLLLSIAHSYSIILCGAALVGTGSSIFHPESSRIARLASGGRHGFAQSVFQVGGNLGSASGPLLAAFVVATRGQPGLAWFSLCALLAIAVLSVIGNWYQQNRAMRAHAIASSGGSQAKVSTTHALRVIAILLVLIFSKYFYMASLSSYYTFYLIDQFHLSVPAAQIRLFVFLGSVAAGTLVGGHIGDRIGRKAVIWFSILGILPFTLILPHANLFWTTVLTIPIGMILASAFPAIVVYAQELLPGKVGTIAGLFFGFAFGMGALGAALLGQLADFTSIQFVYKVCAFLPALGICAALLPSLNKHPIDRESV
jgi:MFS transporter, FSR family, fosmidomycin resistance protein